jgi:hypothetical protein
LKEAQQQLVGIGCHVQRLVGQQKFAGRGVVVRCVWQDAVRRISGRLGISVSIKGWRRCLVARPEAAAAAFVRVRFDHHPIWAVGCTAGMPRSAPTGEARAGKIEAAPKKMHWTLFSGEGATNGFHDALCVEKNQPALLCGFGLVGRVFLVLCKGNRRYNFNRRCIDHRVNPQLVQRMHVSLKKLGDAHGGKRKGKLKTIAFLDQEPMRNEVELHLDAIVAMRHG